MVLWEVVSTVFAMRLILTLVATAAVKHGTGRLDTLDLPIEERVIGECIRGLGVHVCKKDIDLTTDVYTTQMY